jgi:hypothetical protein
LIAALEALRHPRASFEQTVEATPFKAKTKTGLSATPGSVSFHSNHNTAFPNRELRISQNLLDANQIISFHWVSFRLRSLSIGG